MLETAEIVAERYKISREAQDEYALQSQQRTAAAPGRRPLRRRRSYRSPTVMKVTDKATGAVSDKDVTLKQDEGNRAPTRPSTGLPR